LQSTGEGGDVKQASLLATGAGEDEDDDDEDEDDDENDEDFEEDLLAGEDVDGDVEKASLQQAVGTGGDLDHVKLASLLKASGAVEDVGEDVEKASLP